MTKFFFSKLYSKLKSKKIINVINLDGVIGNVGMKQGLSMNSLNKFIENHGCSFTFFHGILKFFAALLFSCVNILYSTFNLHKKSYNLHYKHKLVLFRFCCLQKQIYVSR